MKKTAGKPKDVISKVFDEAGGMLGTSSSSEIPRNRRQIYNIQHSSLSHCSIGTSEKPNPIFELLQHCKMDHMPGGRKFIRFVNFESSPSCVCFSIDSKHTKNVQHVHSGLIILCVIKLTITR